MKETHKAIVVPINLKPHPNADTLSIVEVMDVFTVVVKTEDWVNESIGVYIPPQNIVNVNREEFAFLKRKESEPEVRIKPCKLRGVHSYGLLIKCPAGFNIGDDLTEYFQITHYDHEQNIDNNVQFDNGGIFHSISKYDIDSGAKLHKAIPYDTPVVCTEKIHGANWRCYHDGEKFHVGSRTNWYKPNNSVFWKGYNWLKDNSLIDKFVSDYKNYVVYGEVYGQVQNLKYGLKECRVAVFDIRKPDLSYMDWDEYIDVTYKYRIPMVPHIIEYVFHDYNILKYHAEGFSCIFGANHIREGVVIRPVKEMVHPKYGRLVYKIINPAYKE